MDDTEEAVGSRQWAVETGAPLPTADCRLPTAYF
jgi:hypothetical protein